MFNRLRPQRIRFVCVAAVALVIATLLDPCTVTAQSSISLFAPGDRLEIVRRFNYTLRENGRYQGHVERETRTWLIGEDGGLYLGELMVSENMIHDFRTVAARIESREPVELVFDGERLIRVSGAPVWQALPTVPTGRSSHSMEPWEAGAVARVQLPDGSIWSVPTAVRYEPQGVEEYQGLQVLRVAFGYMVQWPLSPMALEEHPAAGLFD